MQMLTVIIAVVLSALILVWSAAGGYRWGHQNCALPGRAVIRALFLLAILTPLMALVLPSGWVQAAGGWYLLVAVFTAGAELGAWWRRRSEKSDLGCGGRP